MTSNSIKETRTTINFIKDRFALFQEGHVVSTNYDTFMAHASLHALLGVPATIDECADLMRSELLVKADPIELAHMCIKLGILHMDVHGNLTQNAQDFPELFSDLGFMTNDSEPQGSFTPFGMFAVSEMYLDCINHHDYED